MSTSCDIIFENYSCGAYFAGDIITGKVVLQTEKVKRLKGITIKIKGIAHTKCQDGYASLYGNRDYIDGTAKLLGSNEGTPVNIEPGLHKYTFAFTIPNSCPSSFEGTLGHIRYMATVTLICPWKPNKTFTKRFNVLNETSLKYERLNVPYTTGVCKTFLKSSEPLKIDVTIPNNGYTSGQLIPVNVLITNECNVQVEELKISLVMLVRYYSDPPRYVFRDIREIVTTVNGERTSHNGANDNNLTYELLIPGTPPSSFDLCRILKISYEIEVKTKLKGIYTIEDVILPVFIGRMPPKYFLSLVQRDFSASRSSWNSQSYMPPPTYDEALQMIQN